MHRSRALLLALFIIGIDSALQAQGELVLCKEGTTLYHRPGCPVIKDGEGVLAMTRGQAESRGYKPHPDCDPSKQPSGVPPRGGSAASPSPPAPITVYIDGSKYYHRKDCSRLAASRRAVEAKPLEVAGKSYWPCPTCKPPVRRKSAEPAVPGTGRRGR